MGGGGGNTGTSVPGTAPPTNTAVTEPQGFIPGSGPGDYGTAQQTATTGRDIAGTEATRFDEASRKAAQMREELEKKKKEAQSTNHEITTKKSQYTAMGPQGSTQLQTYMAQPAEPYFPQVSRTNFLNQYPDRMKELDEAIHKTEDYQNYYNYQAQGNYAAALQLGQQAQQLTKSIEGMRSDPNSFGGATKAAAGLDGGSLKSSNPTLPGGDLAGNATGGRVKLDDPSSEFIQAAKSATLPDAKFAANIGDPNGGDMKKLLSQTPLVPESFLSDLDAKLKSIGESKDALAVIQEMGKQAGISELANLKSLDELNSLESKADSVMKKNGEAGAAGSMAGAEDYSGGSKRAGTGGDDSMSEQSAEYVKAVQGIMASAMDAGKTKAGGDGQGGNSIAESLSDTVRGGIGKTSAGRKIAAAEEGNGGIGGLGDELFVRARRANQAFYRRHYSNAANAPTSPSGGAAGAQATPHA